MSDLIDRQDAIDALKKIMFTHLFENGEYIGEDTREVSIMNAEKALDVIENLPSAEPERKKGEWAGDCCSCCGVSKYNYIKMVDDECGPFGTWNFCPNCGADMRCDHE